MSNQLTSVLERLQAIWSSPSQAMSVLQKSLTRPNETVETFDLPAYRELMMLYSVARDLSESDATDGDLRSTPCTSSSAHPDSLSG